jgi:hypothetical protein
MSWPHSQRAAPVWEPRTVCRVDWLISGLASSTKLRTIINFIGKQVKCHGKMLVGRAGRVVGDEAKYVLVAVRFKATKDPRVFAKINQ